MGDNVIEVCSVSKRYLLGEDYSSGRNLREVLLTLVQGLGRRDRQRRQELWALKDVSLEIVEGEALGVVGRNGAGKSTLLKLINRITEPTSGICRTKGRIGSLLEVGTGFHPELTGRENIYLNAAILGMGRRAIRRRFDDIVTFAGVERFLDTPIKRYSSGMYLRLAFAVAAHLDAEILLIDEVLAVGDAEFQRRCLKRMADVGRDGRTVVFVSHNLDAIARLCPTSIWLDQGVVKAHGATPAIIEDYLSSGADAVGRRVFEDAVDQAVALRSVSLRSADGVETCFLQRGEPFTVEVRFLVRQAIGGLDLTASVQNLQGMRLLDEAWSEKALEYVVQPGEYCAHLTVPPVLNVGDYTVGIWLGTSYEEFAWVDDALSFHLEGPVNGRANRAIHLSLPWVVERVDAAP